jgi:predicted transcriptional regulator
MSEKRKSFHEFYETTVKDIMQTLKSGVPCIEGNADVTLVLPLLEKTDHIWVTASTTPTQLLGVITESDTIALLSPPTIALQSFDKPDSHSLQYGISLTAGEIMSEKPVTVSPTESIRDVLSKMKEQRIKQLAVVDENERFIGEITLRQLIQEYVKCSPENNQKENIELS